MQCLSKKAHVPGSELWLWEMEDSGPLFSHGGQAQRGFLKLLLSSQVPSEVNQGYFRLFPRFPRWLCLGYRKYCISF